MLLTTPVISSLKKNYPDAKIDVLLPQIFAGDRLTKEDLVRLAEGGLCQLCGSCHWPNCTFGRY